VVELDRRLGRRLVAVELELAGAVDRVGGAHVRAPAAGHDVVERARAGAVMVERHVVALEVVRVAPDRRDVAIGLVARHIVDARELRPVGRFHGNARDARKPSRLVAHLVDERPADEQELRLRRRLRDPYEPLRLIAIDVSGDA
jgi:hypothetical protein